MKKLIGFLVVGLMVSLGGNIAQQVNHQDFKGQVRNYVSNLQSRIDYPLQHLPVEGVCPSHSHDYVLAPWPTTYTQNR